MDKEQRAQASHIGNALSGVISGVTIMWLGIVFLLDRFDVLAPGVGWIWYFLFGLGVILVLEVIARQLLLQHRQVWGGRLIAAVVLMAIGAWQITGLGQWWPLLLVAAGLVLILTSLRSAGKV
ncbi:MAG: hypothetical protein ONB17_01500 [candidate division KSB1 bacterium]|nr:hypothetical protein [candidate division KSB1 bacterium]MDZ7293792.1 hypothetical protein [candidate division KSB1 bacterium]MDZ7378410.1 hypothetical protein [candidate division KSB1 bacterium]MDZ7384872.1 hypothetical protein [candidate division KSB1 bacterium]MDZ7391423.1 hypothetical protein [candidate division KSB1 bacterium]